MREIYDGRWERNVGTDGGQTLTWTGRIALLARSRPRGTPRTQSSRRWATASCCCASIPTKGASLRVSGRSAIPATRRRCAGNCAAAVRVVQHAGTADGRYHAERTKMQILNAANIVTLARTAVERDYRGDVINAHAPEMPTRFAKQLAQMVRGGVAIDIPRERALQLAIRCARTQFHPCGCKFYSILPKTRTVAPATCAGGSISLGELQSGKWKRCICSVCCSAGRKASVTKGARTKPFGATRSLTASIAPPCWPWRAERCKSSTSTTRRGSRDGRRRTSARPTANHRQKCE